MIKLFRVLVVVVVLFFVVAAFFNVSSANEKYFGVGVLNSGLNYDVNQKLDNIIEDNGYGLYVEGLKEFGYPIVVNSDLSSSGFRIFVGKSLNSTWDIETSFERIGSFGVTADLNISSGLSNSDFFVDGMATASGKTRLNINSISLSFIGNLPVTNKFFVYNRLGLSYMLVDITTTSTIGYDYSYDYDSEYSGSDNSQKNRSKKYNTNSFVPYIGLGVKYTFSNKYSARLEYSRSGDVLNDLYLESTVIELLYSF